MFRLISRILNLSGKYKNRIKSAFIFAFIESILSKMPIFIAFTVLIGFNEKTNTSKTFLYVGVGLVLVVLLQEWSLGIILESSLWDILQQVI